MSNDPQASARTLPDRPNLRHLKDQAKDLLNSGGAESIADAQFKIARAYGFASWPKLKARVESLETMAKVRLAYQSNDLAGLRALLGKQIADMLASGEAESLEDAHKRVAALYGVVNWRALEEGLAPSTARSDDAELRAEIEGLRRAIDKDDIARVRSLLTQYPALHSAPLGYGRSGPLTLAAECRTPPAATRLDIVRWMIENGSDVHQGGDAPLMRATLGDRIPMMALLVEHGADVNALWDGNYPILFGACEVVDPVAIKWLLDHGANPNLGSPDGKFAETALDYVIGLYERSPNLGECIDLLLGAGGRTKYNDAALDLLRGRLKQLAERIDADRSAVNRRFPEMDFGTTGARMLTLKGTTLLHVAAEYQSLEAATLLLRRGADVNARADVDAAGVGGHTPMFHAATQREDRGIPMVKLLLEHGADLSVRAKVPGHYERPEEVLECTALEYAAQFENEPRRGDKTGTLQLLRAHTQAS